MTLKEFNRKLNKLKARTYQSQIGNQDIDNLKRLYRSNQFNALEYLFDFYESELYKDNNPKANKAKYNIKNDCMSNLKGGGDSDYVNTPNIDSKPVISLEMAQEVYNDTMCQGWDEIEAERELIASHAAYEYKHGRVRYNRECSKNKLTNYFKKIKIS